MTSIYLSKWFIIPSTPQYNTTPLKIQKDGQNIVGRQTLSQMKMS